MPSFRQVCPLFPALLIDAASARIQVGLLHREQRIDWQSSTDESGVAIFRGIEQLGVDPMAVSAFIFCDGPGSVLGIRTAAMALRAWNVLRPRPTFAYASLALVAHAINRPGTGVIADARRDTWHHYLVGRGLRRVPTADLAGELVLPEDFRSWSTLPAEASVTRVPYVLADLLPRVWDAELLQETDAPDAFLHEEPQYVTWNPRIHQAPTPGS